MRQENGLVRQPGSSSGVGRGGLLIATAICCVSAWASPSTVCAREALATLPEDAAAEVAELETRIAQLQEQDPTPPRGRTVPASARRNAMPYDQPNYWSAFVLYGSTR